MSDKHKQIIIPTTDETRRWLKVTLKDRMSYSLPPRLGEFQKIFKDCDIKTIDVFGIGKNASTVCICKKINGEHAPDCLEHPHLMVCVIDPRDEDNILEIRSLFLNPVEFLPAVEIPAITAKKIETVIRVEEVMEKIEQPDVDIIKAMPEKVAVVEVQRFFVISFSMEKGFSVVDANTYAKENTNFIIDSVTGQWISGEKEGAAVIIAKTGEQSAITVLGGDVDFLQTWAFAYCQQVKNEWKEKTAERVLKAVMDD